MTQRVLITAGASGIGLAMAQAFLATDARVRVTDVDKGALAALPPGIAGEHADVTDEAAMAAVVARIDADWGGLDVLCANAGTSGPTAGIEAMDLGAWRACLAVNLDGAMLAAKHAAPLMQRAGSGVMTFTSSVSGLYAHPFRSPYVAAKWAVIGLMKTVAIELGPHGIRANAICPGAVEGPRIDRVIAAEAAAKGITPDAVREGYASGTALRRLTRAADIAAMAVFLASPGAAMISGQALAVDGFTINPDP